MLAGWLASWLQNEDENVQHLSKSDPKVQLPHHCGMQDGGPEGEWTGGSATRGGGGERRQAASRAEIGPGTGVSSVPKFRAEVHAVLPLGLPRSGVSPRFVPSEGESDSA